MEVEKKTNRGFTSKISENHFIKEKQELIAMGFDEISIFRILNNGKIDYYFSNEEWEKRYMEKAFLLIDPSIEIFYKTDTTLIPWFVLPENNPVMKSRKNVYHLKDGLSIIHRGMKESGLIINLGSTNENLISQIMDSKESLTWMLSLKEKISQRIF